MPSLKNGSPHSRQNRETSLSAPSYETTNYEKSEGIATITLNRPQVLNAVNEKMGQELSDALRTAERDADVRCLIITGKGRAFCSGEDIQDLRGQYERGENPKLGQRLLYKYNPIIKRIRSIEKPVIAAVNGAAAGAGAGIAYSCDIRLASENAKFIQAFIRVGLAPDSGTSFFLPKLVGFSKAMELSLTGDELTAKDGTIRSSIKDCSSRATDANGKRTCS